MTRAGVLLGVGVAAIGALIVLIKATEQPRADEVAGAAPAVALPRRTAPPQPPSPPIAVDAGAAWDEFRLRDNQPIVPGEPPHAPAWCFTSHDPREPREDEAVSCFPAPARCAEVREGEVSLSRDSNEPRRVSECRETRTLWCARTLTVDLWMCRSTRRLCQRHLDGMRRVVRGYDAIADCEERWVR